MEMVILRILVFLMACAVIYMWINYHRHEKLLNDYEKNHNQVKFYVARDRDTSLWLYLGKPVRSEQNFKFMPTPCGRIIRYEKNFSDYGLDVNDYANLKWEDEPVEVFLNLED